MEKLKKSLKICLLSFLLTIGFISFVVISLYTGKFGFSAQYPRCKDAVMEFSGTEFSEQKVSITPIGDVEFYYNQWIISDNEQKDKQIIYDFPKRWTDITIDGKKIPKTGYASYKFTMLNLPGGEIQPQLSTDSSYRLYFNGHLAGVVGEPSKTEISNSYDRKYQITYVVPTDGKVEVVIELGYSNTGGMIEIPGINYFIFDVAYTSILKALPSIAVGLFIMSILIAFVINFSTEQNGRYFLLVLFISLFIHYIFSYDILNLARSFGVFLDVHLFEKLSFITMLILMGLCIFYMVKMKLIRSRKEYFIPYVLLNIISLISFFVFYGTTYLWISYICYFIALLPSIIDLVRNVNWKSFDFIYLVIFAVLIDMFILEMIDFCDIIKVSGWTGYTLMVLVLLFVGIVFFIKRITSLNYVEIQNRDLKIHALQLKQDNLLKQIKPHFIYNSLEAIQAIYHTDLQKGDESLQYFARYLRANVDAVNASVIPFTAELDNIINYVNLNNLSATQMHHLILDIQYEDFYIPMLSIEPLIENAIKYSHSNLKENGFIKISSQKLDNGNILICIEDNGDGFDIENVSSHSKGIQNARERLELYMEAKIDIKSSINKGTEVRIEFKEVQYEGNNH